MKNPRKKYAVYDLLVHKFWKFGIDGKEYEYFSTKKECKAAIEFCNMMFFTKPHKFIVKPYWKKSE